MNINSIKTKYKGESDKYSWQLYQYIIKNFKYIKDLSELQVFFNRKCRITGDDIIFDKNDISLMQIIIGKRHDDEIVSGSNLFSIMGDSRDKYQVYSHHPIAGWKSDQFVDITEWFWKEYVKLGRCLLDKGHDRWWMSEEDRFTYVNNTRRCNWCGQWQEKKVNKVVKIERKTKWINQVG